MAARRAVSAVHFATPQAVHRAAGQGRLQDGNGSNIGQDGVSDAAGGAHRGPEAQAPPAAAEAGLTWVSGPLIARSLVLVSARQRLHVCADVCVLGSRRS